LIHYHGTPLGGTRLSAFAFMKRRHFLVPFARPEDIGAVAEYSVGFCLDNSAFSAWKKDTKIDWRKYVDWCFEWYRHPRFRFALIPDVIDGDEAANDELLTKWYRWTKCKITGVPVWHLHESLDRLERLMHAHERIALGSSGEFQTPNTERWHLRMAEAMQTLCDADGRPKVKIHGLRMLSPDIVRRYPFESADSTNVAQNKELIARFGMYKPPSTEQRAASIADRIESINSPATWHPINKQQTFLGEF
jgi:hypothetical protein